MDSRDLTSVLPSASGDGSLVDVDEDSVISLTATLAKDAALLFHSRKYDECVDVLRKICLKKGDDSKVLHNIAIAEYFRDDCSDPKKLLEVFNNIKKRSEGFADVSGEHVDIPAGNHGNKIIRVCKENNIANQKFSAPNGTGSVFTSEFDSSVATLNMATIWFHLHEYTRVMSILEPLYQNIEPIDETTALHICLLLLDVALVLHDASKSADVITYLEKVFGDTNQADTMSPQQSLVLKSSSVPNNTASDLDSTPNINSSESPLSRALSEDSLESLLSTLDIGQNLTRSPGIHSPNDPSKTLTDQSDLKLKLQLYKVRLFILTKNIKAAKREVKIAMNIARGRDSSMALLLKSQVEYARGNYRKAIKLLAASSNRTELGFSSLFNNNFGCINYQLGKHHTSALFFSRALKSSSVPSSKPLKLSVFSQDRSLLIIYNCGVQYLSCGKPRLAADCLRKASLAFHDKPILWLRIAECCFIEKNLRSSSEITTHVIGEGKWRELVVDDGGLESSPYDHRFSRLSSEEHLELSMPLARHCLLNALHLLQRFELKHSDPSLLSTEEVDVSNHKNVSIDLKTPNPLLGSVQVNANGDQNGVGHRPGLWTLNTMRNSVSDYEDICRRENHILKQALLANLAYVELEVENPLKALSAAKSLLKLPECSRVYIFLGHAYAAEALCVLNRLEEAAEHLAVYLSGDSVTVMEPFSEQDCDRWRETKNSKNEDSGGCERQGGAFPEGDDARGVLYVNLAALCAIRGELEQARDFAKQALSIIPMRAEATLVAVYVDIRLGMVEEAIVKLKRCNRVRFVRGDCRANVRSHDE